MSASHSPRVPLRLIVPPVVVLFLLLITAVSLQAAPTAAPPPIDQRPPTATLTGWFNILWADGEPGTQSGITKNTGSLEITER